MRLVFMGTSTFAVPALEALVEGGHQITGVITRPDRPSGRGQKIHFSPVKKAAIAFGLDIHQPATIKDGAARMLIERLEPELMVVVAYGKIIPGWMIRIPPYGFVNLHGSLLPKYRGAAPINWAIANGETVTGVCTMQVDEGLDTGPVYLSESTGIGPDENAIELGERLARQGALLLARTVTMIAARTIQPVPQDSSRASYAPLLTRDHGAIDWNQPAEAIHNKVRAFVPWPCATTAFRGEGCKILKTQLTRETTAAGPGELIATKARLSVSCDAGQVLEVTELQMKNRKAVSGVDFINGMRVQHGERLGLSEE